MQNAAEKARKFFAQPCDFVLAAEAPSHFPKSALPEVAFIGRSNVGKSSLINALVGRRGLARASKTPGRTRQIVFFNLAQRLMLVDLPGYGYAKIAREEKEKWEILILAYLNERPNLKCVCLLLDARHEPKTSDLEMMDFLDRAAVVYKIVLTKADQLKAENVSQRLKEADDLVTKHPAALGGVLITSARGKAGLDDLRVFLMNYSSH